jgi:general secretion pathway protein B
MSYILQALKKSEAERHLGQVPGLADLTPSATAGTAAAATTAQRKLGRWWMLLTLSVVMLGLGWMVQLKPAAPEAPAARAVPAAVVSVPAPVPAQPTAPAPVAAVSGTVLLPPAAPLKAVAPAPVPAPIPATKEPTPAAAVPAPWPGGAGWPTLALGGSVYAEQPRERLLIINGQVLREGDAASAELVLQSIGPRSAIWRYRGATYLWRYP